MRKLLGYRLNNWKYLEAAKKIGKSPLDGLAGGIDFMQDSYCHKALKQAGVMHWFEEVYKEEELKVGEWYKDEHGGIWFYEGESEDYLNPHQSYGINYLGNWYESDSRNLLDNTPATTEEIQQALIKEAKKRGFKEGVKFNNSKLYRHIPGSTNTIIGDFKYEDGHLSVKGYGGYYGGHTIFKDGKWAEIIPTETLNGKTAIIDGVEYELKIKN